VLPVGIVDRQHPIFLFHLSRFNKEKAMIPTDPEPQPQHSNGKRRAMPKWLIISLAGAGLLILGALIFILYPSIRPAAWQSRASVPTNPAPMDAAPALGPKTAPVTIIEYADFGCPSCWYWHKDGVLKQLRQKYGDQIRFVWRDYAVITLLSPRAAEAGQCANEQGKFWEFHDAVYENNGAIEVGNLKAYAVAVGLNMSKFDECVSSRRYKERVIAEETEAFKHGYNGAPFFLVNTHVLIGGQPLSVFSSVIDPLLATGK
jgi:protein-disulfide isomerase